MSVQNTHSSEIRGVRSFAAKIDAMPEVATTKLSDIRSSHVAPGSRPPKVKLKAKAVHVYYYNEGKCQTVVVVPTPKVTLSDLARILSERYRDPDDRPKRPGQSSKDAIHIPAHIHRQQLLHVVTPTTETPPAMTTNEKPQVSASTAVPSITLSPDQAKAYEILLALDKTGKATSFTVERVNGVLGATFAPNTVNVLVAFFKRRKLIESGQKVTTGFGAIRAFKVHRFAYTIVTSPAKEAPVVKRPSPANSFDPLQHLEWLTKHRQVLEEAERRRRELKKHGYEAVEVKGRGLMLGRLKR